MLASIPEDRLPIEATRSDEADLAVADDPHEAKADLIEGAIGELSPLPRYIRVLRAGRECLHPVGR